MYNLGTLLTFEDDLPQGMAQNELRKAAKKN